MAELTAGRVAITGASGYIGGLVARRYERAGWHVLSLGRFAAARGGLIGEELPFTLGQPVNPTALRDVSVLVHCAYDFALTEPEDIQRVNVHGTQLLLAAAAEAGVVRTVLVSSMSAYEGTTQIYGQAKLACERATTAAGGFAVRLGLVYGDGWGGMAGSLPTDQGHALPSRRRGTSRNGADPGGRGPTADVRQGAAASTPSSPQA